MRIAVLSDIHGNRTAFEAVLADLQQISPDMVLHGGDLADGGSSPVKIVDWIRDLGWQGVMGNTDEMLGAPESLEEFADPLPHLQSLFSVIREMAVMTREMLGEERLAWLRGLPRSQIRDSMALVHASPESFWHAPTPEASDDELESVYGQLGQRIAVYAHLHRPCMRNISGMTVINTGSVGLPYDGDPRASYLLLDELKPEIRRVEYDVNREIKAIGASGIPYADCVIKILRSSCFQMP
jgi:putative phosphoesterase